MSQTTPVDCEEALHRLAEYLDGEIDGAEHARVERHLAACRSCWSRAEFERRLKQEVTRLRRDQVRPGFQRRIRELLNQWRTDGRDPVEPA